MDVEAYHLRGRAIVGLAAETGDLSQLGRAAKCARKCRREPLPYSIGFSRLLLASVDALRDRKDSALAHLDAAEAAFSQANMLPYIAACQWRRAQLLGDTTAVAREALAGMGAANPDRMLEVIAPGFPGA